MVERIHAAAIHISNTIVSVGQVLLYGAGAVITFLAFYFLYLVMKAEANKNTCPNPECNSYIKHCKLHIYGDVWVCEVCNHGLSITPVTTKRVTDITLLHAVRQRLDEDNRRERLDIGSLNYLNWLAGLVEARLKDSPAEED